MSASISHLAAGDVALETEWLRQRCAWCGALLIDRPLDGAEPTDDDTFPLGALVRHDLEAGNWYVVPFDEETDELPDDACMYLPLEITGSRGPGPTAGGADEEEVADLPG